MQFFFLQKTNHVCTFQKLLKDSSRFSSTSSKGSMHNVAGASTTINKWMVILIHEFCWKFLQELHIRSRTIHCHLVWTFGFPVFCHSNKVIQHVSVSAMSKKRRTTMPHSDTNVSLISKSDKQVHSRYLGNFIKTFIKTDCLKRCFEVRRKPMVYTLHWLTSGHAKILYFLLQSTWHIKKN